MNYNEIINKYYAEVPELRHILIIHSHGVMQKALRIARKHPELRADLKFLEEAAMLHDIGIIKTDAKGISCFGKESYIRHGILGAEMLRAEGFERHARVCERHTGTGLTATEIIEQKLPLPPRDFLPESIEEQIICYADKFFSKTRPKEEKTCEAARKSIAKFGEATLQRFLDMEKRFE